MSSVGNYTYGESFVIPRIKASQLFVERDYTSSADRSEDGSKIFIPDTTEINPDEDSEEFVEEKQGKDVKWVYKELDTGWSWLAAPDDPVRGSPRITGLFVSNPGSVLFKNNREVATFTTEGAHELVYTPHEFDTDGDLTESASLSLDGGPELFISQTSGLIFVLADSDSPYDSDEHVNGDYTFVLHGNGPGGAGILADNRGLQRYVVNGKKFATFAGVNINLVFDINELPFELVDIRTINRLSGSLEGDEETGTVALDEAVKVYPAEDSAPVIIDIDLLGHYFVESIVIDFLVGGEIDVPVIILAGFVKEVGQATIGFTEEDLIVPTSYLKGNSRSEGDVVPARRNLNINKRLFKFTIGIGARTPGKKMTIEGITINIRNHVARTEPITTFEPRFQRSLSTIGTHKPSDLEFYFQRSFPDHAKDYQSGSLSVGDLAAGQGITQTAGTELKYIGRQVKDIVPTFEFSDPINNLLFILRFRRAGTTSPSLRLFPFK